MEFWSKFWELRQILKVFYMISRRLHITGRVQGVGFRYALQEEAQRLGLTGWVRNRADGSVEATIQGAPAAIDALTAWARRGPPTAHVVDVQTSTLEHHPVYGSFDINPTA